MRKIYTAVFLGISLFAILGLALGPILQTATAHTPGILEELCAGIPVSTQHPACVSGQPRDCTLPSGHAGIIHFVDIDRDLVQKGDPTENEDDEPIVCMRNR